MVLLEQEVVPPFPCPAPRKPKSQDGGILHTRKGVHVPALSYLLPHLPGDSCFLRGKCEGGGDGSCPLAMAHGKQASLRFLFLSGHLSTVWGP